MASDKDQELFSRAFGGRIVDRRTEDRRRFAQSRLIAHAMAECVDLAIPGHVVLIGARGVANDLLARGLRKDRLVLISADRLAEDCPAVTALVDEVPNRSREFNIPKPAAAILLGVPISRFNPETLKAILGAIADAVHPGGVFVQLQDNKSALPYWWPKQKSTKEIFEQIPNTANHKGKGDVGFGAYITRVLNFGDLSDFSKKFAKNDVNGIELNIEPSASEEVIVHSIVNKNTHHLPATPTEFWPGRPPGRPQHDDTLLLDFIRAVYGRYMPSHRNELRAYIFRHDRKLYNAITTYERSRTLPEDIMMPSERVLVQDRLRRAIEGDYGDLTSKEKASVRKRLWRADKLRQS